MSTVHIEGTDNQPGMGLLEHCLLYIQRALKNSWDGDGGMLGTEDTENQTGGHTQWEHWDTVFCT